MSDNSGKGDSKNVLRDPTLDEHEHEEAKGHRGREAHGGDVAPPNDDQAGRRQSPQSGTPVKH